MLDDPLHDRSLAIVIVSYNARDELDACLTSLVGRTQPLLSTVTVVDNGSTDGTAHMLRQRWSGVHVIETGENLGFARGNNVGIRASIGELVLLINPDTVAQPNAIAILARALLADPHVAAAGPRLVDAQGIAELSFGWTMGPWGELRQKIIGGLYSRGVTSIVGPVERWTRQPGEREWVSGACLLVRRSDLEAVGLFDERYFMYAEDVDLCVALRQRGRRILFVPDAEVVHLRGRSASRNPQTERMRRQSQLAYYEKHHPAWVPLLKLYLRITGKTYPRKSGNAEAIGRR